MYRNGQEQAVNLEEVNLLRRQVYLLHKSFILLFASVIHKTFKNEIENAD